MVWELQDDEIVTAWIEGVSFALALFVIIIIIYLRIKFPKLTAKGFVTLLIGYIVYSLHIGFDFLDTLVAKKVNDKTTAIYLTFDLLDAIFSFTGLFIIGFAFLKIANYGMELWREDV